MTEKEVLCTRNHRMKRYKKDKPLQGIEDLSLQWHKGTRDDKSNSKLTS